MRLDYVKKNAFKSMVPGFAGYLNRYASEVLHESSEELQEKAERIYEKMYTETPEIGGSNNPMADNLYEFITFCAYYEASDHRIGEESVPVICKWMLEDKKILGKIVNFNKKSGPRLMNLFFGMVINKTKKGNAHGEWGNTWRIERNTEKHNEGVSYILYGCPLLAFAKAHGYEKMMPAFCVIDHDSAALMHAKLIRFETEATGGSCCDYWFVGDRSETAKKYADLPKK